MSSQIKESSKHGERRDWTFRVHCNTNPGETVCVTGNVSELGNWNHEKGISLQRESDISPTVSNGKRGGGGDDLPAVWTGQIRLPGHVKIEFRYFVCMLVDNPTIGENEKLHIVRRWESNLNPRLISQNDMPLTDGTTAASAGAADVFGAYDGHELFEHGWLTSESVIQFKISNEPLQFWRKKYKSTPIRFKMVTMNLSRQNSYLDSMESNSMDFLDSSNASWPITEIAVMNEDEYDLKLQEQFGHLYKENEIVILQAQVIQLATVAYMIDFYTDNNGDIPTHIGFCHILPLNFKQSFGTLTLPITSVKQEPIGQITIEYLVVRPMPGCPCDLRVSYAHHWKHTWTGLDVGHRGSGNSTKTLQACANLRENTIASLVSAAERGADFVEFDVQLSKDLVPVLFHDFYVNIGLEQKAKKGGELTALTIPMKDLTLAQLHELKGYLMDGKDGRCTDFASGKNGSTDSTAASLSIPSSCAVKVYHVAENPAEADKELSSDNDHDPFPTLQHALEVLNPHVGFNVEIKWTMQLKDGSWELENPIELNMYLDIVLKVVLQYAGKRKIVFSCFHPDICTMIRLKQNKYPVLFLTQGVTQKYPEYNDPRTQNIPIAILYALSANILGLSIHTEDILRDPSQVKQVRSHGLVAFCWGDDNNNKATIKYLKELGLNGIIYDRIEDHITDEKTNIFLIEDKEELLNIASNSSTVFPPPGVTPDVLIDEDEGFGFEGNEKKNCFDTNTIEGTNGSSNANGNDNGMEMSSE